MTELGKWIKERYGSQQALADELGIQQARISKWLNKAEPVPATYQEKLRGLKYKGPWPREEAEEGSASAGETYVTREEFAEERGALRAEIRLLRETLEKMGEAVRELALRDQERSGPRGR